MNSELLARLADAQTENERSWLVTELRLSALSEEHRSMVWAAAIPHWFDADILAALRPELVDRTTDFYIELQALSFVERFGDRGCRIHDLTRKLLIDRLWLDEEIEFKLLSQRAAAYFEPQPEEENQIEFVYHQVGHDADLGAITLNYLAWNWYGEFRRPESELLIRTVQEQVDGGRGTPKLMAEIAFADGRLQFRFYGFPAAQVVLNKLNVALALFREIGDKRGESNTLRSIDDVLQIENLYEIEDFPRGEAGAETPVNLFPNLKSIHQESTESHDDQGLIGTPDDEAYLLTRIFNQELQVEVQNAPSTASQIAARIAREVIRICDKSDRIQDSGDIVTWQLSLGRHRLNKCLAYYRLGSRQGRIELHSTLTTIVYRHITPNQAQLNFQGRQALIEDFLQGFYMESLKMFRKENELPETYSPKTRLELAEYMAFSEQYAKRRVNLPDSNGKQIIILRAQSFSYSQPQETVADIEADANTSAEGVLRDRVVHNLVSYLRTEGLEDCIDYLSLRLQDLSDSKIDEILGLSSRQRDYLNQRFEYHVKRFARIHQWELVHYWLGADLNHHLGLSFQEWQLFQDSLSDEQRSLLSLKYGQPQDQNSLSDTVIAKQVGCTPNQIQKRWSKILELAWQFRDTETVLELPQVARNLNETHSASISLNDSSISTALHSNALMYSLKSRDLEEPVAISHRQILLERVWVNLAEQFERNATLEVRVTGSNRGGVTVNVQSLRGFIPRSQLNDAENMEGLKGRKLQAKLIEVNPETRKIILSERKAVQSVHLAQLEVGQLITGPVTGLKPFGAFVNMGGTTGLLHVSQISEKSIADVTTLFKVGQVVQALIVDIDQGRGRISLSTKALENFPGEVLENFAAVMDSAAERAERARNELNEKG
jgi:predicted RNA-binding protein with RPS1 domain